jgi:hypothetical protein
LRDRAKAPVRGDEALEHWHDQLDRLRDRLAGFPGQNLGIGEKIAMEGPGQFDGDLHRPVVDEGAEFQLGHGQFL